MYDLFLEERLECFIVLNNTVLNNTVLINNAESLELLRTLLRTLLIIQSLIMLDFTKNTVLNNVVQQM